MSRHLSWMLNKLPTTPPNCVEELMPWSSPMQSTDIAP